MWWVLSGSHCLILTLLFPSLFKKLIYFNWSLLYSIVAFFCWSPTWISHGCTCVSESCTPLPPPSLLTEHLSCRGGTPALWGATAEAARAPQSVYRRCGSHHSPQPAPQAIAPFPPSRTSPQRRCCPVSLQHIPVASVTPPGSLISLLWPDSTIRSGTSEGHCSVKWGSRDSPIAPLTKELLLWDLLDTWSVSSVVLAELSLWDFLTGLRPQQCLKLLNCLLLEFFHVVFLDQGWPQTTETWESETVGFRLGGVGLLYLISWGKKP